jgi:hypothetical protein
MYIYELYLSFFKEECKVVLAIELKELYDKIQMRSSNNLKYTFKLFCVKSVKHLNIIHMYTYIFLDLLAICSMLASFQRT